MPYPGIVGTDDRRVVVSREKAFLAVGHVNIAGFRSTRRCTGTLIAPDRVLTAAHCLVGKGSGKAVPLGHIHFVAGVKRDGYRDHAKAKCVHYAKLPFDTNPVFSPEIAHDMAIIHLTGTLDVEPVGLFTNPGLAKGSPLVHASYPRDSRYMLSADSGCELKGRRHGLWLTDCDTNYASSGGPVLVRDGDEFRLAAIVVGFIEGRFSIAVPVSRWPDLIRKDGCP